MTDRQEALFRTFKPVFIGMAIVTAILTLGQFFTPVQMVVGIATIVAIYLLVLVYEMNLHSVRSEREREESSKI